MIPWLEGVGGSNRRPPEFVGKVLLARRLNEILGAPVFTPWNVGEIPSDDLADLNDWSRYAKELKQGGKGTG